MAGRTCESGSSSDDPVTKLTNWSWSRGGGGGGQGQVKMCAEMTDLHGLCDTSTTLIFDLKRVVTEYLDHNGQGH